MSWRDRLETASFKGTDFLTESHEAQNGRRLVVHEYPGAEEPDVEDLGGKAQGWRVVAYFIGEDYDQDADSFEAVLDEPGADWLTHPWLGRIWARARTWSRSERNQEGGYCQISIDFVPGGADARAASVDLVDVADSSIDDFSDASEDDFNLLTMASTSVNAFIARVSGVLDYVRIAISIATLPLTWASQVQNLVLGMQRDLDELVAMPARYANTFRGITDMLGGIPDDDGNSGATSSRGRTTGPVFSDLDRPRVVARLASIAATTVPSVLTGAPATDPVLRVNLQAEQVLRSRLLVAASAQVALSTYRSEADRDAALTSIQAAIDTLLPSLPDPVFEAAVDMRAAITAALLAQDLAPADQRDVSIPQPAVVLAHRLNVDEDMFIARNDVSHPLFVQGRIYE